MIDDNPLIFAPHSITAATFRRVLRSARSPAFVETDALLAALDDWGADRAIALAFFAKESSFGTRGVAVRTRNWGNLRRGRRMIAQTPHPFAVYARWTDGLNDWCELLKEHYCKRRGLCRLRQILPRYAPSSDGNNPERYADFVVALVRRWQRERSNEMDIIEIFRLLAAGHNGLTAVDYVWNAVFGAIGAATAYLADNEGEVILPRYDAEQHSVELGALGRVLVGAGAGTLVGYSGYVPFIAGVVAPTLLPALIDKIAGFVERRRK